MYLYDYPMVSQRLDQETARGLSTALCSQGMGIKKVFLDRCLLTSS